MRSVSSRRAVSRMTPTSLVSSRFRSSARMSYPEIPGSIRSRMTMSGFSSRAALSASGPLAAVETRKPGLGQVIGDESRDVGLVVHDEDAMRHVGLLVRVSERTAGGSCTRVWVWDRLRSAARCRSARISESSWTTASRIAERRRPGTPASRRSR